MRKMIKTSEQKIDPRYISALQEFIGGTIQNPDFFKLLPEEQKEIAYETLQRHKKSVGCN